eukprot:m51a1_g10540 putative domain protein (389) ;mRNA; r:11208-12767
MRVTFDAVQTGGGKPPDISVDECGRVRSLLSYVLPPYALGDRDGDGYLDCEDVCPDDPAKFDETGVCGCGVPDRDTDGDATLDCVDVCPDDPSKFNATGVCGCGVPDRDTDGDRTLDCVDACPADPRKTAPGVCGCGVAENDSDGDSTLDCIDGCPADPRKTAPGVCGCGVEDSDSDIDEDGLADCVDPRPWVHKKHGDRPIGVGDVLEAVAWLVFVSYVLPKFALNVLGAAVSCARRLAKTLCPLLGRARALVARLVCAGPFGGAGAEAPAAKGVAQGPNSISCSAPLELGGGDLEASSGPVVDLEKAGERVRRAEGPELQEVAPVAGRPCAELLRVAGQAPRAAGGPAAADAAALVVIVVVSVFAGVVWKRGCGAVQMLGADDLLR